MNGSDRVGKSRIAIPSGKISLLSQTPIPRCSTSLDLLTRVLKMDGSDPLVASPLATWSIQLLDSYSRCSTSELTMLDSRLREIAWISATCPPRMDGSDPLVASPLATWSIQFWTLPREPPSSRDLRISATCPPRMDGSDPLVASPLATWSIQSLDFYPANLRAHEIPDLCHLSFSDGRILSWLPIHEA
jgi:hypothetical protein